MKIAEKLNTEVIIEAVSIVTMVCNSTFSFLHDWDFHVFKAIFKVNIVVILVSNLSCSFL
jgi:hypothetical protein